MAIKFYKQGNLWIYQREEARTTEEITVTAGYYKRIIDGNLVSVIGRNTIQNHLIRETPVTEIIKNPEGEYYTDILEFITLTEPFFTSDALMSGVDHSGRNVLNSVFGERISGTRKVDIAAQFQYGYPSDDANYSINGTGGVTIAESMLVLSTGVGSDGSARISNKKALRYIPGHEAFIYFTAVFSEGVADSYQRAGLFDDQNGFYVGFEGTQYTVSRRRNGTTYNIPIEISHIFSDGSFDPTKGNVYRISFGYLGFANINFECLTPQGNWVRIHAIEYAGRNTSTHITNTNLQPRLEVGNTGNTTDIIAKSGSFSAGIIDGGTGDPQARPFALSVPNVDVSPGTINLLTVRNKDTFFSKTNYISSILSLLSIALDLNASAILSFVRNATITNTPTWTDVNTESSTHEYSLDATVSGGVEMFSVSLAKAASFFEDVLDQKLELHPSETMSLLITTPLGTSGTVDLSIRWRELF